MIVFLKLVGVIALIAGERSGVPEAVALDATRCTCLLEIGCLLIACAVFTERSTSWPM